MSKVLVILNNYFAISELQKTVSKELNISYYLTLDEAYQHIIENGFPDILVYDYNQDNVCLKSLINCYEKPPFFPIVIFNKYDELLINNYLRKSLGDFFILSSFNINEFALHLELLVNNLNYKKEVNEDIIFNEVLTTIKIDDAYIKFTRSEFNLFRYLFLNLNNLVTRKEIQEYVWNFDEYDYFSRSIDTYIKLLRKKLGKIENNRYHIITIRGKGYSLTNIPIHKSKHPV
ncbi:MAG: winged helix-turn-helix domain-containing protein [Bacilli bacterium]|nr:winged helix-turn-helix domain-containing protein [Bacilli bacterium]